jgi:hypothetical protein
MTMMAPIEFPAERVWKGFPREFIDWMQSTSGVKNGLFKPVGCALEWFKVYRGGHLPENLEGVKEIMKDCKNVLAFAELPERVYRAGADLGELFERGTLEAAHKAFFSALGITAPFRDALEFCSTRIVPLPPQLVRGVGLVGMGGLLIAMSEKSYTTINKISAAAEVMNEAPAAIVNAAERSQSAWLVICLSLIELAKAVSYLALAMIALVSALIAAVPHASLLMLICTTSALVYTIIGEFANRAYPNVRIPARELA